MAVARPRAYSGKMIDSCRGRGRGRGRGATDCGQQLTNKIWATPARTCAAPEKTVFENQSHAVSDWQSNSVLHQQGLGHVTARALGPPAPCESNAEVLTLRDPTPSAALTGTLFGRATKRHKRRPLRYKFASCRVTPQSPPPKDKKG